MSDNILYRALEEKSKAEKACLAYRQEWEVLKKQNKKLYDIMYEILGVVKLKQNFGIP